MTSVSVDIDQILEDRDVEAALYLLSRLLGVPTDTLGQRRVQLARLKWRLQNERHISEEDKKTIIASYREVIG